MNDPTSKSKVRCERLVDSNEYDRGAANCSIGGCDFLTAGGLACPRPSPRLLLLVAVPYFSMMAPLFSMRAPLEWPSRSLGQPTSGSRHRAADIEQPFKYGVTAGLLNPLDANLDDAAIVCKLTPVIVATQIEMASPGTAVHRCLSYDLGGMQREIFE